MLTPQDIAARLKEARERASLTQEDVAKHLGLPRSAIALMETAKRKVSGLELARLAYLYGRSPAEFLAREFEGDGVSVLLRALPEIPEQEAAREAVRKGVALAREIANLERLLGVDRASTGLPQCPSASLRGRWEAVEQGKRLAHQERQRMELGTAPLGDLGDLLENQGITVLELELPQNFSGFTIRLEGRIICGVNTTEVTERQRFSLAHEYCHALLDHDRPAVISRQEENDELREVRANAFAAAFLMPYDGLHEYLLRLNKGLPARPREAVIPPKGDVRFAEGRLGPEATRMGLWHVCLLAAHFRVSRLAMIWQLFNLRFITEEERFDLLAAEQDGAGRALARLLDLDGGSAGESQAGKDRTQLELPPKLRLARRRLLHLALEALRNEAISRRKFQELVDMSGSDPAEVGLVLGRLGAVPGSQAPESENQT